MPHHIFGQIRIIVDRPNQSSNNEDSMQTRKARRRLTVERGGKTRYAVVWLSCCFDPRAQLLKLGRTKRRHSPTSTRFLLFSSSQHHNTKTSSSYQFTVGSRSHSVYTHSTIVSSRHQAPSFRYVSICRVLSPVVPIICFHLHPSAAYASAAQVQSTCARDSYRVAAL